MRKLLLAFLLLGTSLSGSAQQIRKYEYWFDQNEKERVAQQVGGDNIDLSIDVSSLNIGIHCLALRVQDSDGKWSSPSTTYFLRSAKDQTQESNSYYDYWIDSDTGSKVSGTSNSNICNLDLDVSTLSRGMHTLCFRTRDNRGFWSAPQTSFFMVTNHLSQTSPASTYEYWIDGKYAERQSGKGSDKVVNLNVDVSMLSSGLHSFAFRTTDQFGRWSAPQTSYFIVGNNKRGQQEIRLYRYWFNDAVDHAVVEKIDPAVIPFTLDAKLPITDIMTEVTKDNITMTNDGEGHMKLATRNVLHTQYCTTDGRWTVASSDTFAVAVNAREVDLTSFIQNPTASDRWNGWKTEGYTTGIQNSQSWENGGNYFRLGSTSRSEWASSMEQTITGLPAGTYTLSTKGRAAAGVEMEISANGFTEMFPATGTDDGELGNGWNELSIIFTTDGLPFVIKVNGSAKSSSKWMDVSDFKLTYTNASNATLMVSMPESTDMQQYKNLKLQLSSVSSKLSVTTSENKDYTFQGLTAGVAYDLTLTNRYGQIVASKKGITIEEGDNRVTLTEVAPLCNIEAVVTDRDDADVTEKTRIAWLLADGTPIAEERSVKGLLSGTNLLCNVILGDSLGCVYHEIKGERCQLNTTNNTVNIKLQPIELATIVGKVLTRESGTAMRANVSVTSWLNNRYSKTLTAKTDAKGVFSSECHQDSLHIVVSAEGYLDCVIDTMCTSSSMDLGTLQMKEIKGIVISTRLNYASAVEEEGTESVTTYIDGDNVDYSVTNLTANAELKDVVVQSGQIVIKSGAAVGDHLAVRIHSRRNDFADTVVETVVTADETATSVFDLVEKGGAKATYKFSGNTENIAMLYNADGVLVERAFYNDSKCTFSHIADGHYTLLSMGKALMLDAIIKLQDLKSIGLTENADYVLSKVEVKAGKLTAVNIEHIPAIDETLFYYTGTSTSFTANKNSVVVGNYVTLTARIDFKEEYAGDVDNLSLIVDLPEGMEYVNGSAIIGTVLAPCSVDGNRLTISLNRNNYQERIRFCVVPTMGGTMMPTAYAAFSLEGDITQPIGSASVTARDMSISVPATVAKTEINVSGTALPYSKVTVYDGSTSIGQFTAKADGNWLVKGDLVDPYNLSTHIIYAHVVTPQGIDMNTESVRVLYDRNAIEVKTVTMFNTAHTAANLNLYEYRTVFDFQNPSQEIAPYWYWPSYPDFTFLVDLTNNDPERVSDVYVVVKTSNDEKVRLKAEYFEPQDRWIAKYKFYSHSLPVGVGVSYSAHRTSFNDREDYAGIMRREVGDSIQGTCTAIKDGASFTLNDDRGNVYMYGLSGKIHTEQYNKFVNLLESLAFSNDEFDISGFKYYSKDNGYAMFLEGNDSVSYFIQFSPEGIADYQVCIDYIQGHKANPIRNKAGMYEIPEARNALEEARDAQIKPWLDMARRKMECADDDESEIRLWDAARRLRNSVTFINASFATSVIGITSAGSKESSLPKYAWNATDAVNSAKDFAPGVDGLNQQAQDAIATIKAAPSCGNEPDDELYNSDGTAKFVMDPSGYVYEAVSSNRLEGVTATIYQKVTAEDMYGDKHEDIVKWDAEPYSQKNPVKTDFNGLYAWDVPDGLWQVKFEKEGYETVYSDWLPVPPPQLDVNVPMYQSVQPEVTGARGFESGVDFTFSKYMRPETFTDGCVTLNRDGQQLAGQLTMLDVEKEPLDGIEYASHIKFVPEQSLHVGDVVTLTIYNKVKSYCGVAMEKDYVTTLVIQPEIKEIVVDPDISISYGRKSEIAVSVLPADAAKGKRLKIENGTPSIIGTECSELVLDADGKAVIPVTGALPGTGALRLSVENSDAAADVAISVTVSTNETSAPEASIPSGSSVVRGAVVTLSCQTEGATIYYTTDGSCPCDENGSRKQYTEPVIINSDMTLKAMAESTDGEASPVVTFIYSILQSKAGVALNDGWNWVSFNMRNDALESVNTAMASGSWTSDDVIKDNKHVDMYSANQKLWMGTLSKQGALKNTQMYKVHSSRAQVLGLTGEAVNPAETAITLGSGWNYISYLPLADMSVTDALADYRAENGDVIKSQDAFATYSTANGWEGDLRTLTAGRGYMLKRGANATRTSFCYPTEIFVSSAKAAAPAKSYRYADNMNVVGEVEGIAVEDGDSLVAYVNGEIRGASRLERDRKVFLTIMGDNDASVALVLQRDGEIIATASSMIGYRSNNVLGTSDEPTAIKFISDNQNIDGSVGTVKAIYSINGIRMGTRHLNNIPAGTYIIYSVKNGNTCVTKFVK